MAKIEVNVDLLTDLYRSLQGLKAVSETLLEKHGIQINYTTVSRRLREAHGDDYKEQLGKGTTDPVETPEEALEGVIQASGEVKVPDTTRKKLSGKRFVITSAQNNTNIHEDFFASLLRYCDANDAELIVSKFSYNLTGYKTTWYDKRLHEYFVDQSCEITPSLIFCGELDILPTAEYPTSGLHNYTQGASGIIPHAKMQLHSLPRVLSSDDPRFLYTTGAVTKRNYIDKKAGQKAAFHHVYGALVVEVDEVGDWFVRQISASEDGSFYDLNRYYTPDGHSLADIDGIVFGDIHRCRLDQRTKYAHGLMREALNPSWQVLHDLTDFRNRNHHDAGDPWLNFSKSLDKKTSVFQELLDDYIYLQQASQACKTYVINSNHNNALARWLKGNQLTDSENLEFWHTMNARVLNYRRVLKKFPDAYQLAMMILQAEFNLGKLGDTEFIPEDGSLSINDIQLALHGHNGVNGARGNPKSYRSIGQKCTTGHTHSASIQDGVYTVGTSSELDMGYNKGPTSWSHTHCIQYKDGKRSMITNRGIKWRA